MRPFEGRKHSTSMRIAYFLRFPGEFYRASLREMQAEFNNPSVSRDQQIQLLAIQRSSS